MIYRRCFFVGTVLIWFLVGGVTNLLVGSFAQAKTVALTPQQELAVIGTVYSRCKGFELMFQQEKTLQGLTKPLRSEGRLQVTHPYPIEYSILKPEPLKVTFAAEKLTLNQNGETIEIPMSKMMTAGKTWQALKPLLQMDFKAFDKDYKIHKVQKAVFKIEPKTPEASPWTEILVTTLGDGTVRELALSERSGDQLKFLFRQATFQNCDK